MAEKKSLAGNPLFPIAVVAAAVAVIVVGAFVLTGETPPDEPTVIAEDDAAQVDGRPAGAGTAPEGEIDTTVDGVTDQLDEVTPAAGGTIPAAEQLDVDTTDDTGTGEDGAAAGDAGDSGADASSSDGPDARLVEGGGELTSTDAVGAGGADGEIDQSEVDAARAEAAGDGEVSEGTNDFLADEDSDVADSSVSETMSDAEGSPAGRDTRVTLDPEEGQDITTDPDGRGQPFVATPSGPEGRDDSALTAE